LPVLLATLYTIAFLNVKRLFQEILEKNSIGVFFASKQLSVLSPTSPDSVFLPVDIGSLITFLSVVIPSSIHSVQFAVEIVNLPTKLTVVMPSSLHSVQLAVEIVRLKIKLTVVMPYLFALPPQALQVILLAFFKVFRELTAVLYPVV